ncbi:MAG: DUF996 domain-containing protein [Thaumarchaeota archaeon]|nr:DUF996 domain-containing protein [Nitrososphaerota archaeon]MCL5317707.1 DUF996 domain-containing protein [Nitrososphaerota archaeon]
MTLLSQARTYGGVGSILILLAPVPSVGWLLSIVGFILTLLAVKNISEAVGDRSIFNNMLISVVLSIVGVVVAGVLLVATVFRYMGMGYFTGPDFTPSTIPPSDLIGFVSSIIIALAAVWIFLLASAIFLRRSYTEIAARLNIKMFSTAALLFLIGAALTIIIVGFVLIPVAQILLIIAFFSIVDVPPQSQYPPPPPSTSPPPPPPPPPPPA